MVEISTTTFTASTTIDPFSVTVSGTTRTQLFDVFIPFSDSFQYLESIGNASLTFTSNKPVTDNNTGNFSNRVFGLGGLLAFQDGVKSSTGFISNDDSTADSIDPNATGVPFPNDVTLDQFGVVDDYADTQLQIGLRCFVRQDDGFENMTYNNGGNPTDCDIAITGIGRKP